MSIVKDSITDQIYKHIREQIIKQEREMGEQISPKKVAQTHDVSVMPVRDALLRLENHGLVVNKPRIGFFVRSFSVSEINEIMEIRKMYESYCLENHFSQIDIDKIEDICDTLKKEENNLTRETFDEIDFKLHEIIIQASNNSHLQEEYKKLIDIFQLFRYLNLGRIEEAHKEHLFLVEAILNGNKEKSVKLLKDHLTWVTEAINKRVTQNDE